MAISPHHSRTRLHFLNGVNIEIGKNVAPPISGSVVSNPSMANTVAEPRFIDRKLLVKFAPVWCPSSSCAATALVKSRALRGRLIF